MKRRRCDFGRHSAVPTMDRTRYGGEREEGWLYFSQNGTAASTHWQTDNMTNCSEIRAGDLHFYSCEEAEQPNPLMEISTP